MHRENLTDHVILTAGALIMSVPVFLVILVTTHAPGTLAQGALPLLPGSHAVENYTRFFGVEVGFSGGITGLGMLWNSLLLATGFAALKVVLSLMAAYSLFYFRLPGASMIFWLLVLSMMLPLESRFLPTYDVVARLGLVNSYGGLVLPLVASGVGTFFFRQFLQSVPDSITEAARLDGCGPLRFLVDILWPLSRPMAFALFLVAFVNGWNQYLWPVLATSNELKFTLVRGIQYFGIGSLNGYMLGTLAIVLPVFLIVVLQRQFIKGLFDGSH